MFRNSSPLSLKQHLGNEAFGNLLEFARKLDAKSGPSTDELLTREIAKLDRRIEGLTAQITHIDVQIKEVIESIGERLRELEMEALDAYYSDLRTLSISLYREADELNAETEALLANVFRPEQTRLRTQRDRLLTEKSQLENLLELSYE